MERIKSLGRYQKGILLLTAVIALVFTAIYPAAIAREGFEYKDVILRPYPEHDATVYSGKIHGKQASFTVYADQTVTFQYADKTYGPYTAMEDPSAIPEEHDLSKFMTGIELRCGEEILFRGGVLDGENYRVLFSEDGTPENIHITVTTSDGTVMDENGAVVDPMEPHVSAILDLMIGPDLTHKGDWLAWLCGMIVCIMTVVSILFAEELFRWNLAFRIRNADQADPSDWEIASRYIAWTILPLMALMIFVLGLQ